MKIVLLPKKNGTKKKTQNSRKFMTVVKLLQQRNINNKNIKLAQAQLVY